VEAYFQISVGHASGGEYLGYSVEVAVPVASTRHPRNDIYVDYSFVIDYFWMVTQRPFLPVEDSSTAKAQKKGLCRISSICKVLNQTYLCRRMFNKKILCKKNRPDFSDLSFCSYHFFRLAAGE
jgi:hypothetical protein